MRKIQTVISLIKPILCVWKNSNSTSIHISFCSPILCIVLFSCIRCVTRTLHLCKNYQKPHHRQTHVVRLSAVNHNQTDTNHTQEWLTENSIAIFPPMIYQKSISDPRRVVTAAAAAGIAAAVTTNNVICGGCIDDPITHIIDCGFVRRAQKWLFN